MILAADYPFLEVLWTLLIFFVWVSWLVLLIRIVADVFKRHDIGGGKKTLWLIFILLVPFIGAFSYLIANSDDMARRDLEERQRAQAQFEDYVRSVAAKDAAAAESRPLPT